MQGWLNDLWADKDRTIAALLVRPVSAPVSA
jgi:hypothetical protein